MALGRNGERVANTPILVLPPRIGGRTVGDHLSRTASENCHIKALYAPQGVRIPVLRLKNDAPCQLPYHAALPGDTEFAGKIIAYAGDDLHADAVTAALIIFALITVINIIGIGIVIIHSLLPSSVSLAICSMPYNGKFTSQASFLKSAMDVRTENSGENLS